MTDVGPAEEPGVVLSAPGADSWFDSATGLPGPALWRAILSTESARVARYKRQSTVVLLEIRGLDVVVRRWGHDVAEQLLLMVAREVRSGSRASDHPARLDLARFGVILTETDEIAAINFVERVRQRCERHVRGAGTEVLVAFGWASPGGSGDLLQAAEEAEQRLERDPGDRVQ